jgi:hypothetical protein
MNLPTEMLTSLTALAAATKAARTRTGINFATRTCRTAGAVDVVVVRYNDKGTSRVQVVAEEMSIDGAIRMFDEMQAEVN